MHSLKKYEDKDHYITHCRPLNSFDNYINLEEKDAYLYLKGEVLRGIDVKDGWVVVGYEGLGLGWGKAKDGVIKNHYPKGLRNLN